MLGSLGGAHGAFRGLNMGVCGICGAAVKLDLWRLVLTDENRKKNWRQTHYKGHSMQDSTIYNHPLFKMTE